MANKKKMTDAQFEQSQFLMKVGDMSRSAACRKLGLNEGTVRSREAKLSQEEKEKLEIKCDVFRAMFVDKVYDIVGYSMDLINNTLRVYNEKMLENPDEVVLSIKELKDLVTATAILVDKERLITGQSTENLAVATDPATLKLIEKVNRRLEAAKDDLDED